MLKERRTAAEAIASKLRAAEAATEKALLAAADLNTAMLMSRAHAKISPLVGQDALDSGAAAFAAVTLGMRQLVDTHARLNAAKNQIGLGRLRAVELGFGDVFECPDIAEATNAPVQAHLTAVA